MSCVAQRWAEPTRLAYELTGAICPDEVLSFFAGTPNRGTPLV